MNGDGNLKVNTRTRRNQRRAKEFKLKLKKSKDIPETELNCAKIMGKKNRSKEESVQKLPAEPTSDDLTNDEDEALIPLHTKQASFALLYLLFFSVLMFTLPFCAFYGMRYYLEKNFDLTLFEINCWSVLSAVVTVNIVIVMYIFKAFKEVKEESDAREAIRGKKAN